MDEMTIAVAEVLIEHRVQHSIVIAGAIMKRLREGPRPVAGSEGVDPSPPHADDGSVATDQQINDRGATEASHAGEVDKLATV